MRHFELVEAGSVGLKGINNDAASVCVKQGDRGPAQGLPIARVGYHARQRINIARVFFFKIRRLIVQSGDSVQQSNDTPIFIKSDAKLPGRDNVAALGRPVKIYSPLLFVPVVAIRSVFDPKL